MAFDPPVPAVVPNTVPDPLRKSVAVAALVVGGLFVVLGVICTVFPQLGGNADPALRYGSIILGYGGVTIWDRQVPTS